MYAKVLLFLIIFYCECANCEIDHGYLPNCPGSERPAILTDSVLNNKIFFVVQVHFPNYTHRKRYYFKDAVEGIGNDPDIDFRRRKTMVFLDGYMDNSSQMPSRLLQGSYARNGYNTLTIDSQMLSSFLYPIAARANRQIGNITATLLNGLMRHGLKAKDIELIGISMGGQTVSFVAKNFIRLTGQKVGRITSLDPSGPCFRNLPVEERLNPTDGDFVQVLHTASEGYGLGAVQGHVDFYINGAEFQYVQLPHQPWCDDLLSHVSVFMYYITAYHSYPDHFIGVKCKNAQQAREHKCYDNLPHETNVMGPKADPSKPGIYYVPVSAEAPFFAPKDFLETRPNYPLLYNDALSDVEHFVLSECFHCNHQSPI